MIDKVKKLIYDIVGEQEIGDNSSIEDDLGLDSLDAVELIMGCEEEFGIEINDDEVDSIKTFNDTIVFLKQKLCKKQNNK